jgi:hypothetical protein
MILKISRQDCLAHFPKFPQRIYNGEYNEETYIYPEIVSQYILTLPSISFRGHAKLMGIQLAVLLHQMNIDELIFLGDTTLSWRYQENEFKPVRDALQYLVENKIGKNFNGAIRVDNIDVPLFIKHFAWLVRCNASLPYFSFTDPGQNIMGRFCQFGNLHLDILNQDAVKNFKKALQKTTFEQTSEEFCFNRFGKSSAIHGRRIVL